MATKEQIKEGLDKAYKEAGDNAYFANGFEMGVRFEEMLFNTGQLENKPLTIVDCKHSLFYGANSDEKHLDSAMARMFSLLRTDDFYDVDDVEPEFWKRIVALANRYHNPKNPSEI